MAVLRYTQVWHDDCLILMAYSTRSQIRLMVLLRGKTPV
jgi:hypothetical protein